MGKGCQDVCIDIDYWDDNEFYSDSLPIARKQHTCCECQRKILVGEKYENARGKTEGDFWQAKTCRDCLEIRTALVCGSWIFGHLWGCIEEYVFPVWLTTSPLNCLAKIESRAARDVLCAKFDSWRAQRDA